MWEGFKIPAGFHQVDASKVSEVLSLSGSRNAMYFFNGDKIECSDEVLCQERTVTRNGKEEKMPIYYLICRINEGAPKAVPFASFRRFPKEVDNFLNKSDLMRDLYDGSDSQRFELVKGRKLEVIGIEEGEAIDWTKSNPDTREFVYKKAKFPVLDYAK